MNNAQLTLTKRQRFMAAQLFLYSFAVQFDGGKNDEEIEVVQRMNKIGNRRLNALMKFGGKGLSDMSTCIEYARKHY